MGPDVISMSLKSVYSSILFEGFPAPKIESWATLRKKSEDNDGVR